MDVVVAQLVERSLLIPEVRGSNPVIGKIYWIFVYCQLYWKDENKEKRGREWPIFKKKLTYNALSNINYVPLIITGGAADKSAKLKVGDEILSVNNTDCTRMTRLEAWNFMKKLADGYASLMVRQKLDNSIWSRDMIQSMSSGALSDSGNKSDSSLSSDNSELENKATSSSASTPTSSGKPSSADLASETSLESTKVEAKRWNNVFM